MKIPIVRSRPVATRGAVDRLYTRFLRAQGNRPTLLEDFCAHASKFEEGNRLAVEVSLRILGMRPRLTKAQISKAINRDLAFQAAARRAFPKVGKYSPSWVGYKERVVLAEIVDFHERTK
jgi:hypothetical protein